MFGGREARYFECCKLAWKFTEDGDDGETGDDVDDGGEVLEAVATLFMALVGSLDMFLYSINKAVPKMQTGKGIGIRPNGVAVKASINEA